MRRNNFLPESRWRKWHVAFGNLFLLHSRLNWIRNNSPINRQCLHNALNADSKPKANYKRNQSAFKPPRHLAPGFVLHWDKLLLKAAAGNVGTVEYWVTIIVIGKQVKHLLTVIVVHDGIVIQRLNRLYMSICHWSHIWHYGKYKTEFEIFYDDWERRWSHFVVAALSP